MAEACCDDIIAKVEGKPQGAKTDVHLDTSAGEVQAKSDQAKAKEQEDAKNAKPEDKAVPKGPDAPPGKVPHVKEPAAGAAPAPKGPNAGKEDKKPGAEKKALPGGKGGGAPSVSAKGPAAAASANVEADVMAFLEKYEPKSKEPKEREAKVDELAHMAGDFKGKIAEGKGASGFLAGALSKVKDAFDVTKDVKDMLKGFQENPYKKSEDKLGKIANICYDVREVTKMIGGICGKVGLACTILSLLTCWVPPVGAALQVIGRVLNIIGIVCDVINLAMSGVLIALNMLRLRDPNINPEEKAAIADQMIKDATEGAGSVMSLAMSFGGKFLGPLKKAKNGILGPLQKWVGAALKRVKTALAGYAKKFGMKIVHMLGMGVKKVAGTGIMSKVAGGLGTAAKWTAEKGKKAFDSWGKKYMESSALANKWGKNIGLAKVEGFMGQGEGAKEAGEKAEKGLEKGLNKATGGESKWGKKLEDKALEMEKGTVALEKKFTVDEAKEAEKYQIKYDAKQAAKEQEKAGGNVIKATGDPEKEAAAWQKFEDAAKKQEQAEKDLAALKDGKSTRVDEKGVEAGKKFDEEHKLEVKDGELKVKTPESEKKEADAATEKGYTTTNEEAAKKENKEAKESLHDARQEAKEMKNPTHDEQVANYEKQAEAKKKIKSSEAEIKEVEKARETAKEQSKIIAAEQKKASPNPDVIAKAEAKKEEAEKVLGLKTKDMETYNREQLKDAEKKLKLNPKDQEAQAQKQFAEQQLEHLGEARIEPGKEQIKDKIKESVEEIKEGKEKEEEKDKRKEAILHKYGADHEEEVKKAEEEKEKEKLKEEVAAQAKEVHVATTTEADVNAILEGIDHAEPGHDEHHDQDDGGDAGGGDQDQATVDAQGGGGDQPQVVTPGNEHAPPADAGGGGGGGGGEQKQAAPAAAKKEEPPQAAAAGGDVGGAPAGDKGGDKPAGGGDEAGELPFWPSLKEVHSKELKTLADARTTIMQFKAQQHEAGEKAKEYEQKMGVIKDHRKAKEKDAHDNQQAGTHAAADQRGGIPGAQKVNSEAGKGEDKKNEGTSAASEKVTVEVPEPKSSGWFSRILNSLKRWFVNKARAVMQSIQNAIAEGVLRMFTGGKLGMKDLQAYAECQRGMKERGGKAGDKAAQDSGQAASKEKQTEGKAGEEEKKAQEATREAENNCKEADQLLTSIDEQEAAVKAEDAATVAFINEVVAEKKQEEAKKKAEEEKAAADEAKAKQEGEAAKKQEEADAKKEAAAKAAPTKTAQGGGPKKKGDAPKKDAKKPEKKEEVSGVDKGKIAAAASTITSHIDSYASQLSASATEQGQVVTKLASKRNNTAGPIASDVQHGASDIVEAFKQSGAEMKQKAETIKSSPIESKAQVTQMAGQLRSLAHDVDAAAQAAAEKLNSAFRKAYDAIAAAPSPVLTRLINVGKTGAGAYGMGKSIVSAVTPMQGE